MISFTHDEIRNSLNDVNTLRSIGSVNIKLMNPKLKKVLYNSLSKESNYNFKKKFMDIIGEGKTIPLSEFIKKEMKTDSTDEQDVECLNRLSNQLGNLNWGQRYSFSYKLDLIKSFVIFYAYSTFPPVLYALLIYQILIYNEINILEFRNNFISVSLIYSVFVIMQSLFVYFKFLYEKIDNYVDTLSTFGLLSSEKFDLKDYLKAIGIFFGNVAFLVLSAFTISPLILYSVYVFILFFFTRLLMYTIIIILILVVLFISWGIISRSILPIVKSPIKDISEKSDNE